MCSRQAEYQALGTSLQLNKAVVVQPLAREQIEDYLVSGGEALAAVRAALHAEPDLQELLDTPLMLSVLALTYHGLPEAAIPTTRQQVFAAYVQRMLTRRQASARYPAAQTRQYSSRRAAMRTDSFPPEKDMGRRV